jgi:ribonucleoside-diphosphate reductase alpha chain
MMFTPLGEFASRMVSNKYAHTKPSGHKESWPEIAERVVKNVVQPYYPEYASRIQEAITSREFIPGGRYLYAAGRRYQQLQNCFLFKAEDSREGWATLDHDMTSSLMTGGGVGVVYSDLRPEGSRVKGADSPHEYPEREGTFHPSRGFTSVSYLGRTTLVAC